MKDFTKQIKEYYDVEIEALKRLDAEEISKAMNVIHQCYLDGGETFISLAMEALRRPLLTWLAILTKD